MTKIRITQEEFTLFSKYILDISGIALEKGKEYLLETRLSPMQKRLQVDSYEQLLQKIKFDRSKNLENELIDAISTNETYFFRDKSPFKLLQYKILPDLMDRRTNRRFGSMKPTLRIWSAANSTGQELYSIAMILLEMGITPKNCNMKLLGTDISDAAIHQSSLGVYNKFEVSRGLDPRWLTKYFTPHGDKYKVKEDLRSMVHFQRMNLMNPLSSISKFDIVLCRNVMIYFTPQDRKRIYTNIAKTMEDDAYLLIGSTESLVNDTDLFSSQKYLNAIFYQKK